MLITKIMEWAEYTIHTHTHTHTHTDTHIHRTEGVQILTQVLKGEF